MSCNNTCSGCSDDGGHGHAALSDIEDYKARISQLEARNEELEGQLSRQPASMSRGRPLRSSMWFGRKDDPLNSALYVERYLNTGLTREELMSNKPIIGIAQSGSDIAPCNRHHLIIAKRVREGIRSAGGIAFEFPTHPIQESSRRPSATLDRNLSYLTLVELLHAYPFDGVVLLTGCDKTTPACLMAAATVDIPAICLNVGPMVNGWMKESRVGSGTVVWKAREMFAAGQIGESELFDMITSGTPSPGHCNTMGTAATMNALAEALGMALPHSSAIPASYRERLQCAYQTGLQIVEMVRNDRKPSDIMTREAFENAIVVNTAIGGSTNAPIHLNAIAKHIGLEKDLDLDDWERIGFPVPLLLNMQPAGEMLSEDYHRAGGLPAILAELLHSNSLPHPDALICNGSTIRTAAEGRFSWDRQTIKSMSQPMLPNAGFLHLTGNLFDSAIMKTSVISPSFRKKFLEDPTDPNAFECEVAVFDGPEDYHKRIDHAKVTERTILVMRGVGPLGYPGAAEVVNMDPPSHLLKKGIRDLPCVGDGRQSGTSGSPSILNASPEAADGGNLALVKDGDKLRVDLNKRRVDLLVPNHELSLRREQLEASGGYHGPPSQTPWQDIFRRETGGLSEGMVLRRALRFQRITRHDATLRDNH